MSCRARFDMRAVEDSSESIRLPFNWSFERCTSSCGTGSDFSFLNSETIDCTTLAADSRDVPAYTDRHPVSRYGLRSLYIAYASPCRSRMFWNNRELIP